MMDQNFNVSATTEYFQNMFTLDKAQQKKALQTSLQMVKNPFHQSFNPEKIKNAEPGIHSSRIDRNYRIIWKLIKPNQVVLCFIDKHDAAYLKASRTSFTLADGVVSIADIVKADPVQTPTEDFGMFQRSEKEGPEGDLFLAYKDQELRDFGVPDDIFNKIRSLDNLNQLGELERLLPIEVYDTLIAVAIGEYNRPVVPDKDLGESIDRNQGGEGIYQFLDSEEFERALEGGMEKWMLFLAPHQRRIVNRTYAGPARVKGVVGSGKTVVAIHRLVRLAREAHKNKQKVLFLTYGNRLPEITMHLVKSLAGEGAPELEAIECKSVHSWCGSFIRKHNQNISINNKRLKEALENSIKEVKENHPKYKLWEKPDSFFKDEISIAIKGKAVASLNEYLALDRSGRGTSLNDDERKAMYQIYEAYQKNLGSHYGDYDDIVLMALKLLEDGKKPDCYRYAVIDEIQDLTSAVMRVIRQIIPEGENDLFMVGDGLQRIYPGAYVLSRLGIDIVGRGTLLEQNYRNTQEILQAAFSLMENQTYDDMETESLPAVKPEYSLRRGEKPILHREGSIDDELRWVAAEIKLLKEEHGYQDRDFAVLYRWRKPYKWRVKDIFTEAGITSSELTNDSMSYFGPGVKLTTFHSSKGLEFKVVFVVGVTDTLFVPKDDWNLKGEELQEYHNLERALLYVAMTRARDLLSLSYSRGVKSRFLEDVPDEFLITR